LFQYIQQNEWLNSEIERIREHYYNWNTEGAIDHVPIQGIEIHGWNLIHSTIINIANLNKHDDIFDVVEQYLRTTYDIEESLLNDLMTVQRNYLIKYNNCQSYPKKIELQHDIFGYVQGTTELDSKATYEFDFPEDKEMSLQQFCEQIFFARRRNFGKAWVSKV
jgi:hypothetical protein